MLPDNPIVEPKRVLKATIKNFNGVTIKGEKGDTGEKGEKGSKGDKGPTGAKGKDGKDGRNGVDGKDGVNGVDGTNGKDGKDGKDGSPDTPEEIIEKVNKSKTKIKSYQVEGLTESFDNLSKSVTMGGVQAPILDVYNAGALVKTRVTKINFSSGATVSSDTVNVSVGGGGGTITTQYEGSTLSSTVTTLNFTGAGVTASGAGATTTINIPGGGGGSATKGIAEVDFGVITTESDIATVSVANATVTSTSYPSVSMYALATTDHDPDDYMVEGLIPYVTNVQNGVGFDISVRAPNLTFGKYKVTYQF